MPIKPVDKAKYSGWVFTFRTTRPKVNHMID
ncbi:hypothetical protein FHU11_3939 [Serratia fonticola]|nr:hypothetical protein FHU11_3939 [Serratia fonticola]